MRRKEQERQKVRFPYKPDQQHCLKWIFICFKISEFYLVTCIPLNLIAYLHQVLGYRKERDDLNEAYHLKLEENERAAEERTAKKRQKEKRLKILSSRCHTVINRFP
jgi:hypothetical protein